MTELKLPTREQLEQIYKRDLEPAFPPAERKPLEEILRETDRGEYRPWCLFEDGEIVGEAFVWTAVSGFALFDYLCVPSARRNGGLGAGLVRRLVAAERGRVLFGESEIPRFAADPALAERRLGFYRRNGARQADYDSCIFGVPYHTLYWSERTVDGRELSAVHAAVYRSSIPKHICDRYIIIPWEETMGLPGTTPWLTGGERA